MKLIKYIAALAALIAAIATPVSAQQGNFDYFGAPRTFVVTPPTSKTVTFSNTVPVDIHGSQGIAKVDFSCVTNTGGTTVTASLFTSPDQTNWTALANYALATSTAIVVTNTYYGTTNLTTTNTILLPGVLTTPSAATAGFANQYILPAQYTNSGAVTLTGGACTSIGFNIEDQQRYLSVLYTLGATTNASVSAVLTTRRTQ